MILNINKNQKIYLCCTPSSFSGGVLSFQIKIRAYFKEEDIPNSYFIFCSRNKKQIKIYYEDNKGSWLTIYRLHEGRFEFPESDGNSYRIDLRQLEWLMEGISVLKREVFKK